MKKLCLLLTMLLVTATLKAQHLYPEHYSFKGSRFCLDCGDPKAMPPDDICTRLLKAFNKKAIKNIEGDIYVQVLIDSEGKAQLVSADNQSNVTSKKLRLQKAINSIKWSPAVYDDKDNNQSVQLLLAFHNGAIAIRRVTITFGDTPVKEAPVDKDPSLTFDFEVFNTANSELPWNMSRAVASDTSDVIWMGTDEGLARFAHEQMSVYNHENSPLGTYPTGRFQSIMALGVDKFNRKWISQGYDILMYNDTAWVKFDTVNSPLRWCTNIDVDYFGDAWFSTSNGAACYKDGQWETIDSTDYPLPSNRFFCVYNDSRGRTWIGSVKGSVMVEDGQIEDFSGTDNSIKSRGFTKICEDDKGNLWFTFFRGIKSKDGGIAMYDTEGQWHEITCPLIDDLGSVGFGDIVFDAKHNLLWLSPYHIGLLMYDFKNDYWELYTPENSDIPHSYIQDLTIDKEGVLWGATFGGFFRMAKE